MAKIKLTDCIDCDNLSRERSSPDRYWLCLKFPRIERRGNRVRGGDHLMDEPYMRAWDINGGACPLYEPLKEVE